MELDQGANATRPTPTGPPSPRPKVATEYRPVTYLRAIICTARHAIAIWMRHSIRCSQPLLLSRPIFDTTPTLSALRTSWTRTGRISGLSTRLNRPAANPASHPHRQPPKPLSATP